MRPGPETSSGSALVSAKALGKECMLRVQEIESFVSRASNRTEVNFIGAPPRQIRMAAVCGREEACSGCDLGKVVSQLDLAWVYSS